MNKIVLLIVVVMVLLSCSNDETGPDPIINLMISPSENHIVQDSMAEYEVRIENASRLFAFSGELLFDSSIIEIQSEQVSSGSLWNIDPLCECIAEPGCLNLCIGLTQTNGTDMADGSGTLFNFLVKGINIGQSEIRLRNIQLIDENGALISKFEELELTNATVYVETE